MFDPTIFDNLKVGFENYLYDLDNLTEEIVITDRKDMLDMATMSREFSLEFVLPEQPDIKAEVYLKSTIQDLADEILESPEGKPGCLLLVRFYKEVHDIDIDCSGIESLLSDIWELEKPPKQTLSYRFHQLNKSVLNMIEIDFERKINENQMQDIPEVVSYMITTLEELDMLDQ